MKRAGYTIVELLVVIVISALLTTAMIAYSSKSRAMLAAMVEKATMVQVLQRARSLAISTYSNPSPHCAIGVAIDFNTNTYALQEFDSPNCVLTDIGSPSVTRTTIQRYSLNPQVKFVSQGDSLQYVLFIPPEPSLKLWGNSLIATTSQGSIILGSKAGGENLFSIQVNEGGLINF